jgi:hypothetical protein
MQKTTEKGQLYGCIPWRDLYQYSPQQDYSNSLCGEDRFHRSPDGAGTSQVHRAPMHGTYWLPGSETFPKISSQGTYLGGMLLSQENKAIDVSSRLLSQHCHPLTARSWSRASYPWGLSFPTCKVRLN